MRRGLLLLLLVGCDPDRPKSADSATTPSPALAPTLTVTPHVVIVQGEPAVLSAQASGGDVSWTFGDGETGSGAEVEHAWAEAGNYTAIAELRADDGRSLTAAVRVEVFRPPAEVAPVWSAPLDVDAQGRVWVVTPEADTLAVLSATEAPIYLPTCDEPRSVAVVPPTVAVSCGDGQLWRWDQESRVPLAPLTVGHTPWGVVGRDGVWWVVLGGTGEIVTIAEDDSLSVTGVDGGAPGVEPRGLALGPTREVYTSRFRSDPEEGTIYRLDRAPISLPVHPGPDSDTLTGGVPTLLESIVLSPDGETLYVPMLQANVGRGLLTTGVPLSFETTGRAALAVVPVGADAEDWASRKIFDNQDRAAAVAPSPTGNYLAVAHPGTGVVQLLDAFTLDLVGSLPGAGEGLRGIRWVGSQLFVWAWLDRTVSVWEVGEPGEVPSLVWSAAAVPVEPLAEDVLLGKKLFYRSGDPRIAKDGYIACASCHPDGEHDGLTWDFTSRGEGLRNTTTLVGRAGTGMGFLHWSANFDEVQDFENDIRNQFGGTGLLTDTDWAETSDTLGPSKAGRSADLDALAAYVTSLDQTPASPWPLPEGGLALLESHGCPACHPAPGFTDSTLTELRLHDVGTLTAASGGRLGGELPGIDTPTLLGAWASAPYLHDGSAATLSEAIAAHTMLNLDPAAVEALAEVVRGL